MTPAERSQLIDDLLEGSISDADFIRLESELSIDPNCRRDYYDRVALSLLLETEAAEPGLRETKSGVFRTVGNVSRRGGLMVLATVAVALFLIVSWQWGRLTGEQLSNDRMAARSPIESDQSEPIAAGFAVVAGQADAVWKDGKSLANGSLVPSGELHLQSGVVQFELFSGVTLVVEGASQFEIVSSMEVVLNRGKARARVPEPAQGFRILTAAGEVVDLGTEFAVSVADDRSEVHVLDGEVQWHPRGLTSQRMREGEAARMTSGGEVRIAARADEFVGPRELRERLKMQQTSRFRHWLEQSRMLRQDERLIAYYQVTPEEVSDRRLPNLSHQSKGRGSLGTIVAAAPASNRWGQASSALDFSPAGSRVRLSVPDEYGSLTLICWVKINSLDRWYNSLFLTDGHDVGEPHWQIMDDGRLFFSVKKRDRGDPRKGVKNKYIFFSPPFWTNELSGQWLMIATVYDIQSRQVTHFLNGEILSQEAIPEEYLVETVRIGNASIGNWGLPVYRKDPEFAVRNLNGSLDEFALFSAALTPEEIRKLYDDGQP